MRATALYIAKYSRRRGRCGRCGHAVTWATLASKGTKNIPLVAAPQILREEQRENGVSVEVLAFDQVHRCQAPKVSAPRRAPNRTAPRHVPTQRPDQSHAYAAFNADRLDDLKRAVTAAPIKPPAPPLEKRW